MKFFLFLICILFSTPNFAQQNKISNVNLETKQTELNPTNEDFTILNNNCSINPKEAKITSSNPFINPMNNCLSLNASNNLFSKILSRYSNQFASVEFYKRKKSARLLSKYKKTKPIVC